MKSKYRNSIRSKELIKEAMINLLNKNKSISEITVSDIVKTANINRGTFYNHYNNTIEVLEEMKDSLMQKLTEALKLGTSKGDLDEFLNIIVTYFKNNEKEYKKIIDAIPMSIIDDLKQEFIKQIKQLNFNYDELTIYFLVNGISGIYLDYLKNNINFFTYDDLVKKIKIFVKSLLIL